MSTLAFTIYKFQMKLQMFMFLINFSFLNLLISIKIFALFPF